MIWLSHNYGGIGYELINHLRNVAKLSRAFGLKINDTFSTNAYAVGLFHDLGKAQQIFLDKILTNSKSRVDHLSVS